MRRFWLSLLLSLLLAPVVHAENTHGVPDPQRELQAWFGDARQAYVVSGCLPAVPGASATLSAFACTAYIPGSAGDLLYVVQSAIALGPLTGGDGTYWLGLHRNTSTAVASWTRQTGTHYLWIKSASQPSTPSNTLVWGKVTIAGGVITAVSRVYVTGDTRVLDVTRPPYSVPHDGTGNAATGINQALVDASAGGYTVFLPCGSYRTTAQILLQDNTSLVGASRDCAVILPDTGTSIPRVVLASSVSHTTVRDLQVDCQDATVAARQGIAALNTATYMSVERVYVQRCGQYGVLLHGDNTAAPWSSGGAGMVIRDSLIDMTGVPGGACAATEAIEYFPRGPVGFLANPGPLIEGNTVIAATADVGIKTQNAQGARVIGNFVSGATCATATGAIDVVVGGQDTVVIGNTITDTRLGIAFGGIPRSNATGGNELRDVRSLIRGNTIRAYSVSGIFSSDGTSDTQIDGNTIVVDGAGGTRGIDLKPSTVAQGGAAYTRPVITNNTIVGNATAISLQESTDAAYGYSDARVQHNTLSSTIVTAQAIFAEQATNGLFMHHLITGHRNGIAIAGTGGSNNVDLSHNTIRDINSGNTASQACMSVVGNNARILGNYCENTSGSYHAKWGLSLNATLNPTISGNRFISMDTGDITLVNIASMTSALPQPQACQVVQAGYTAPADTNENDLASITLPAAYFTPHGGIKITAFGEATGAGGVKTMRLYFGGTAIGTALSVAAGTNTYRYEGEVLMVETNVTSQHAWVKGYDGLTLETNEYAGLSINTTTGTVIVKVTGQKASAGDVLRQRGFTVCPWR